MHPIEAQNAQRRTVFESAVSLNGKNYYLPELAAYEGQIILLNVDPQGSLGFFTDEEEPQFIGMADGSDRVPMPEKRNDDDSRPSSFFNASKTSPSFAAFEAARHEQLTAVSVKNARLELDGWFYSSPLLEEFEGDLLFLRLLDDTAQAFDLTGQRICDTLQRSPAITGSAEIAQMLLPRLRDMLSMGQPIDVGAVQYVIDEAMLLYRDVLIEGGTVEIPHLMQVRFPGDDDPTPVSMVAHLTDDCLEVINKKTTTEKDDH
jgi:hypothetical protein